MPELVHYVYAKLTDEQYEAVRRLARRDRQNVANFVRSCINDRLTDEQVGLLIEQSAWIPLRMAKAPHRRRERD